jgi:hypothetical protein
MFDRGLAQVWADATLRAGSRGTDSLDLLEAALSTRLGRDALKQLRVEPSVIQAACASARSAVPGPGLTDDARRVIEAMVARAVEGRRDLSAADLLIALATTTTSSRSVLLDLGIGEAEMTAAVR